VASKKTISAGTAGVALLLWLLLKKTRIGEKLPIIGDFFLPRYVPGDVKEWYPLVNEVANEWKFIVLAIIWQESSGKHTDDSGNVITGGAGEIGLCQILPSTGAGLGYSVEDLKDPRKNIRACADYVTEGFESWNAHNEALNTDPPTNTNLRDILRYYNGGPLVLTQPLRSAAYSDQVLAKYDIVIAQIGSQFQ